MDNSLSTATWIKSSHSGDNGGDCVEVAAGYAVEPWIKSSYSGPNGGDCVEVAPGHAVGPWVKSRHSGSNGGDCVEVAAAIDVIAVRDSKDTSGPILSLTPSAFAGLLTYAKNTAV
ncbi:DUF397 domain-containing protein [Streptomyces sp. NPDC051018]|uniref:DUF397 domain-containing protein n=1 Tax=Streptomyces sp. NPDC051018 TaxID=3365639 RepID=UPI0037B86E4B